MSAHDPELMNIWIVKHDYAGRRWCKVMVRGPGEEASGQAYVWAEWTGPSDPDGDAIVPRLPDAEHYEISNTDPLVIGRYMYFDYCMKSHPEAARGANELERGDLIIFASRRDNAVIIDTVFVVGAWQSWPAQTDRLPWEQLDELPRRVHFHEHALAEHPFVRTLTPPTRSYRGQRDLDGSLYSWVPAKTEPNGPFGLPEQSDAMNTLQAVYRGKNILNGLMGSFTVVQAERSVGARLHEQLREAATAAGFDIAAEVALCSNKPVSVASTRNTAC